MKLWRVREQLPDTGKGDTIPFHFSPAHPCLFIGCEVAGGKLDRVQVALLVWDKRKTRIRPGEGIRCDILPFTGARDRAGVCPAFPGFTPSEGIVQLVWYFESEQWPISWAEPIK